MRRPSWFLLVQWLDCDIVEVLALLVGAGTAKALAKVSGAAVRPEPLPPMAGRTWVAGAAGGGESIPCGGWTELVGPAEAVVGAIGALTSSSAPMTLEEALGASEVTDRPPARKVFTAWPAAVDGSANVVWEGWPTR